MTYTTDAIIIEVLRMWRRGIHLVVIKVTVKATTIINKLLCFYPKKKERLIQTIHSILFFPMQSAVDSCIGVLHSSAEMQSTA